jgi:chromosomal replication initiator protein
MDARQVWQNALERIQQRVSRGAYTTWFRGAVGVELSQRVLVVAVSNTFAAEHLSQRFADVARAAVSQALGAPAEVRFIPAGALRAANDAPPAPRHPPTHEPVDEPAATSRRATPTRPSLQRRVEVAQSAAFAAPARSAPQRGRAGRATSAPGQASQQPGAVRRQPPLPGLTERPTPLLAPSSSAPVAAAPRSGPLRGAANAWSSDGARPNPRFTFETFMVGTSNRFAYAASQEIVNAPGERYNPLYIYGGVGLGKTHLLHAIGQRLMAQGLRVVYVSAERFTNEIVEAIRRRTTQQFRDRYRAVDALLMDDAQFIAGRESTEEEFFHTFNWLHEANKQIVLTSDRPPRAMRHLHDRLRSRFEWGLLADIQPPDYEGRLAILRSKAQALSVAMPEESLARLAHPACESIRELEGELTRVIAYAQTLGQSLDPDTVTRALGPVREEHRASRPVDATAVLAAVAERFSVSLEALLSKSRERQTAWARQVAMYLMREETSASLFQIGDRLGGRDHTTIMHGCSTVAKRMEADARARADVAATRALLRG